MSRPTSETAVPTNSALPPVVHVERDRHTRELVSLFLTRAGFQVEAAENGAVGLERVRRHGRALVISEILVPEMDGLSLCRAIKSDANLTVGVVILSVLAARERAQQAGADAFFVKPIDEQRLMTTLRHLAATLPAPERPLAS